MTFKKFLQPLDRAALVLMLVLSILIGLLVLSGDRTAPRVRDFSWQNKQVGAEDTSFTLTFSRPMDHPSVEAALQIEPLLPGKVSWAGRRMVYTLLSPAAYGTKYKMQLENALGRFTSIGGKEKGKVIQPFASEFSTRDRALVYLGVEGEEKGRLILYNFTQQQKSVLTPSDMVVTDFKPYPQGDRILFSASDWKSQKPGASNQQLYTVTTGTNPQSPGSQDADLQPKGKIDQVLDSKDYQNMKFDLSADGQTIVVQRAKQGNPGEFGLWVVQSKAAPKPLENEPGGDFTITPDSTAVAMAQGQGVAILPLIPKAKPLDFLPQFGKALSFSRDGTAGVMLKFNTNNTESLFLVTNSGIQKELLRTQGSIMDALFDPLSTTIYCLLTELLQEGKEYREQPYIYAIDLKTNKVTPLLALPEQRDIQMSLSPDGLALLFDQVVTTGALPEGESLTTSDGQAIATSRLWLLPLTPSTPKSAGKLEPEELPLPGFHPRWLP